MLLNHGSVYYQILFLVLGDWKRILLLTSLAFTDFKKFSKKILCPVLMKSDISFDGSALKKRIKWGLPLGL